MGGTVRPIVKGVGTAAGQGKGRNLNAKQRGDPL